MKHSTLYRRLRGQPGSPGSLFRRGRKLSRRQERSRPRASRQRPGDFADLPLDWQLEITRRGVKRGFENGEQFLANLPEPWKCPLPWSLVSRNHQEKAVKLQKALARVMELRAHGTKGAELESIGLEDYKAVFGYGLKDARHFRRLLHRTIDRDAGDDNWQRLEIYLDDRAFRRPRAPRQVVRNKYVHRELDETIATLENRQSPTATDREFLWDAVFRHYEQHTGRLTDSPAGNRERRLFRASLVHYLFKAFPERTLCATAGSLKRRFDEKLMLWREKGCTPEAMQDRRGLNSGNFSKEDFSKDPAKILERAALLEWDIDRAIETLTAEGKLSQFAPDLRALWERAILHDGNIALAYRLLHESAHLARHSATSIPLTCGRPRAKCLRGSGRRGATGQDEP